MSESPSQAGGAAASAIFERPLVLTRESLEACTVEVLNRGGSGNPDVLLARDADRLVVVKDFAPRRGRLRRRLGRWITSREVRAYRVLEGVTWVPRLLGSLDELALVLEYRPGVLLSRSLRGKLPSGFVAELRDAVGAMHDRGVVHLDLRHRSNVLAGEDGHPVLIDFASALCFRPGGLAARLLLPWLARIDRGALCKWELRLEPELEPGARDQDPAAGSPGSGKKGTGSLGSRGAKRPM
jgi:serine/threonine protein kinase